MGGIHQSFAGGTHRTELDALREQKVVNSVPSVYFGDRPEPFISTSLNFLELDERGARCDPPLVLPNPDPPPLLPSSNMSVATGHYT